MVSVQPLSSFWSRAPLSKAFTTSHLIMTWENYDIYIRLQLPYPTWCCCLLLLFVTCTCSFWTLLAETERRSQPPLSPVWWRGPQLVTLVTLVTLDQPQIETPPPLSLPLWGPNIVSGVHFDWSGSEYVAIVVNKIMFVLITITPGSKVTQSSGALLFVTTIVI